MVRLSDEQIRLEKAKAMGIKVSTCNVEECDHALAAAQLRAVVENIDRRLERHYTNHKKPWERGEGFYVKALKELGCEYEAELEEAPDG